MMIEETEFAIRQESEKKQGHLWWLQKKKTHQTKTFFN